MQVIRHVRSDHTDVATYDNGGHTDDKFFIDDEPGLDISVATQNGSRFFASHSLNAVADFDQTITRLNNDLIFADTFE